MEKIEVSRRNAAIVLLGFFESLLWARNTLGVNDELVRINAAQCRAAALALAGAGVITFEEYDRICEMSIACAGQENYGK